MQTLWESCLRRLEQELPAQQFNTWIRPLAPESGAGNDTLVLAAPNRFVLELVRERFAARIERLVTEACGRETGLRRRPRRVRPPRPPRLSRPSAAA
jgi:chromosomal replication initiator protein